METEANQSERAARMSTLANARWPDVAHYWSSLGLDPSFEMVRGPEIGLIALRGRIGGGGSSFNFGEATATRATVKLEDGSVGHAVVLGRDKAKARVAAVVDALAQNEAHAVAIKEKLIEPLAAVQASGDHELAQETAATRVDFFTMVRGDD